MVEHKEAKVIAAATQVFMRYGYRRATMGDIAEAAGISRPALYLVFSSKEEILTAVLARVFTAALEEIRQNGFQQRRRTGRVNFDDRLPCIASSIWPSVDQDGRRCAQAFQP